MKKILFLCIWLVLGTVAAAEEEALFSAEDFANQSTLWVQNDKTAASCQAVRILPKWYLTAAHCVRPCGRECTVTVQLLQGTLQAQAVVRHSQAEPHVFVPAAYHPGDGKSSRSDIALIRFDPSVENYYFYDARANKALDRESFEKRLHASGYSDALNQWQALASARPKLLSVTNTSSRQVLPPLAVPDLRGGDIYFRQSGGNDFYYFTQLHHYMGPNFGVEKGMSGSGVVVPGGAVVGVVSGGFAQSGRLVIYDEQDNPVQSVPYSSDYFLFTPISRENAGFIQATIKSFHEPGLSAHIGAMGASYSRPTQAKVQDVFPDIASEETVLSTKVK